MDRVDPADRPAAIVRALVDARRSGDAVTFSVTVGARTPRAEYADRTIRLEADDDLTAEDPTLASLLEEYRVFKLDRPATRKADPGVVHVSAVADPKHTADFLDAVFRDLFDAPPEYELRIE